MSKGFYALPTTSAEVNTWDMNEVLVPRHMVTIVSEINATKLSAHRENEKTNGRTAPSYTAMVVKAVAETLQRNPEANRGILGPIGRRRLYQFESCDVSVAVEKTLPYLPGHPFAGLIKDTLKKSCNEVTQDLQQLAKADLINNQEYKLYMKILRYTPRHLAKFLVCAPHYSPALWTKLRGSAAWVNAPSKAGADLVIATWPWPLSFSFGVVKTRPGIINDKVEPVLTMPVSMVFDRRVMGGGPASRVFESFKKILQETEFL